MGEFDLPAMGGKGRTESEINVHFLLVRATSLPMCPGVPPSYEPSHSSDRLPAPHTQVSWKLFLTSTAAPGNGGPLLFPKGQEGKIFYEVPPPAQSKASSNSAPAPSSDEASASPARSSTSIHASSSDSSSP